MSFGTRLTTVRKDKKIAQNELSIKASIHVNVLGRYERGEATPSVEVASKIVDAVGVLRLPCW